MLCHWGSRVRWKGFVGVGGGWTGGVGGGGCMAVVDVVLGGGVSWMCWHLVESTRDNLIS